MVSSDGHFLVVYNIRLRNGLEREGKGEREKGSTLRGFSTLVRSTFLELEEEFRSEMDIDIRMSMRIREGDIHQLSLPLSTLLSIQ